MFDTYDFLTEMLYNSAFSPSTVHGDAKLTVYFAKYLFQKALAPFKFTIPETWPLNFFLYTLYGGGVGCVFDAGKFGTIYQNCTLAGRNIFYQPTTAIVANPVLHEAYPNETFELEIGEDCELIYIQPDFSGIMDIVTYYADLMATFATGIGMNVFNTKMAYVFAANTPAIAESFKRLYDDIMSGKPAVVGDKKLFDSSGNLNVELFNRDLKASYIVSDMLEDMRKVEEQFLTEIGIPNANTDKKERLITSEVESNNFETRSKCEVWLDNVKICIDKINAMFPGLGMAVDWRESNNAVKRNNKRDVAV